MRKVKARRLWLLLLCAPAACNEPRTFRVEQPDATSETSNDAFIDAIDTAVVDVLAEHASETITDTATDQSSDTSDAQLGMDATDAAPTDSMFDAEIALEAAPDVVLEDTRDAGMESSVSSDGATRRGSQLATVNAAGTLAGNAPSELTARALSGNGRYLVFSSRATDLVTPPITARSPLVSHIYLRDLQTGETQRISRPSTGSADGSLDADADSPMISEDGNTVVFRCSARNLVSAVDGSQLYRWSRSTNRVDAVLLDASGLPRASVAEIEGTHVSQDGLRIAFATRSILTAPPIGSTGEFLTYTVDLSTANHPVALHSVSASNVAPQRAGSGTCGPSPAEATAAGAANAFPTGLSRDGRTVLFTTVGYGLVMEDGVSDVCNDMFVSQHQPARSLLRVNSRTPNSGYPTLASSLTGDGSRVAVVTRNPLGSSANDTFTDVFLGPADGTAWQWVSVPIAGRTNNGDVFSPSVSADGRYVAFVSESNALVEDDTNMHDDVFVRDLTEMRTVRVSVDTDGRPIVRTDEPLRCAPRVLGRCGTPPQYRVSLSPDGSTVAFSGIVSGDGRDANLHSDIYVYRLR